MQKRLTLRQRLEVRCHDETHQPSNWGNISHTPITAGTLFFIDLQIRLQHSQKFLEAPLAHSIQPMEFGLPLQFLYMSTPTQTAPCWIHPSVAPTTVISSRSCYYYIINFIIIKAITEVIFKGWHPLKSSTHHFSADSRNSHTVSG